jgi:hypothetical protein
VDRTRGRGCNSANLATLFVASMTLAPATILVIIILHVSAN